MTDLAGAPSGAVVPTNVLEALDDSKVTGVQWKIMLVSGMGFFTDAYDLFVIGIVVALLTPQWHLSTSQVSLLNSATLAASAVGAIIFGRVADMIGRKKIYGFEVLILAAGAIASAFSPNYTFLLVSRIVLGIGIGGDYPVSATIMSEFSGKKTRGRMVGLVFAMQGAGLVVGPLVAAALLVTGVSDNLIWRILLGLGAVPGLAVFYMRRKIQETPRFALAGGASDEAALAVAEATGNAPPLRSTTPAPTDKALLTRPSALGGFAIILRSRRLVLWLIGCSGAWMLLDFAYYGNSISSPEILKLLNPGASLLHNTLIQLLIFCVFALPGYALAISLMDKSGRKTIQIIGFAMMGLSFFLIGAIPGVTLNAAPFVVLYGISYFFTEFGPNTTTFIYPAEIFPVEVRTTSHGIAAASGKMGAFAGAYLFPVMLRSSWGIRGAELVSAIVAVIGLILTVALLPEPKGKSLEELTADAEAPAPPKNQLAKA